jgi:hypothetical protein
MAARLISKSAPMGPRRLRAYHHPRCLLLTVIILSAAACAAPSPPATTAPAAPTVDPWAGYYPLGWGARWIYAGAVKWEGCGGVCRRDITWKMEVLNVVRRGELTAYALHGHPSDLAFYSEGKFPSVYTIVRQEYRYYGASWEAFVRLRDDLEFSTDVLRAEAVFLEAPLVAGQRFGEATPACLEGMYCWVVSAEPEPFSRAVVGLPADANLLEYTLTFSTLPDHIILQFAPGLGITRYVYGHHGSVSEVDVRLIEYHAGSGEVSP